MNTSGTATTTPSAEAVQQARSRVAEAEASGRVLDITRGKPSPAQLDLAEGLLETVTSHDWRSPSGVDCRNYGGLEGLPEARQLFAAYLEVPLDALLLQDNSSLRLMYDTLVQAVLRGVPGSSRPWGREERVRFLCPVPGYDRHFFALEQCGIEMLPVGMTPDGPEMETVQRLVAEDASIRGIFCVPRHSNPTGVTYSAEVVRALAEMKTAAPDFRISWDTAYHRHHLTDDPKPLADILAPCEAAGHADRVLFFGSTSKISLAGAGVAMMAGSTANVAWWRECRTRQTTGPDKLNQLRHLRFFRDLAGIEKHMQRHAEILRPKFELTQRLLRERLGPPGKGLATWTDPEGGYFVSLDVADGCARAVVERAGRAGVKLTAVGAPFPHGNDPHDRNIRLAPSFPSLEELEAAMGLVCDAVVVTVAEKGSGAG